MKVSLGVVQRHQGNYRVDHEAENSAQYLLADSELSSRADVDGCEKRDNREYVEAGAVKIVIDLDTDGQEHQRVTQKTN